MNKKLIVIILAVLLVVGAGIAVFVTQNNDANENSNNNQTQQNSSDDATIKNDTSGPTFDPLISEGDSFIATYSGTTTGDEIVNGTFESDGEGKRVFRTAIDGEESAFYITEGLTILCQMGQCYGFENTSTPLDTETIEFDNDDIEAYKDNIKFIEEVACDNGQCEVWEYNDPEDGSTGRIYIDKDSKRVVQLTATDASGTDITVTYDYDTPVSITIPENYETLPGGI